METVIANLTKIAGDIQALLEDLLLNHSSIYLWNTPNDSLVVISVSGNYAYRALEQEGRQIQSRLLDEYRRFREIISALLRGQPKDTLDELAEADETVSSIIEQSQTWCKSTQEAFDNAVKALQAQLGLLARLYDSSGGETIYVPDTNALLFNPDLESWRFTDSSRFRIILLPIVLSELDALKINHRNEDVRNKAEKLIRMIKEYRRRGDLRSGVALLKDMIYIQALVIEPDMEKSLPWLDPASNDDRLLAGVIQVMRSHPRSPVVAVSRDINLQNKAEFAKIPFVEPPDP